jgi:hypothetical protein
VDDDRRGIDAQTASLSGSVQTPNHKACNQRFRWSGLVRWACQDLNLGPHPESKISEVRRHPAAANTVLHVDRSGRVRTVAVLASMARFGGRPAQGVPTGVTRAADGAVHVALFGGAPATGGPAVVVALRPSPAGDRAARPATAAHATAPIGALPTPGGLAVLDGTVALAESTAKQQDCPA